MPSDEGNEINKSNQQKSNFARAPHIFVLFFTVVLHDYNVKLPETSQLHFLWRKCTCSRSLFFFTTAHFHLVLVAASISHFVTAATNKLSCGSSRKKMSPWFFHLSLQISVAFFLVELRWPVALLSLFLCLSLALYSKFVDMTINLSLVPQTTRIQNNFRFPFSSLLTLQLSLLYKTLVGMRFPAKITPSCI